MQKSQLLALVEEGFEKAAWHGPNLRSALRGVSAREAAWRPTEGRHNIWEISLHAAFWKHTVTLRLTGNQKDKFPEKGRNWFPRYEPNPDSSEATKRWKHDLALLVRTHRELCDAIQKLKESDFTRSAHGCRQTALRNIMGIAMHDAYHAGQIQLLRKLYCDRAK